MCKHENNQPELTYHTEWSRKMHRV